VWNITAPEEGEPHGGGSNVYLKDGNKYANCGYCHARGICPAFKEKIWPDTKNILDDYSDDLEGALEESREMRDSTHDYDTGGIVSVITAIYNDELSVETIEQEVKEFAFTKN